MLANMNATATIGVKDLKIAKDFYQNKLGLTPVKGEDAEVAFFKCGNTEIEVYHSEFGGTNKATALTWAVGDKLEEEVKNLSTKGIAFEHYQGLPDTKVEGDIHVLGNGEMRAAWFKDPSGNILCMHDH
jgi:catechol 2,3-dioxygenase-like lactoylglutathione lyase family enzyme